MRVDAQGNLLWSHRYETYPTELFNGSIHGVAGIVATPDGGFAALLQQPMPQIAGKADDDTGLICSLASGDVRVIGVAENVSFVIEADALE